MQARIAELEQQNLELQADERPKPARSSGRGRTAITAALIIIGLVLAPLATVGTWARAKLVDSDSFVAALAPLAADPLVQDLVADEVANAIEANIDIDGMVGEVFDGVNTLDLPPKALAALSLLEGPAAAGVRSALHTGVSQVTHSEQFAQVWEVALRETHTRAIGLIQSDPNGALQLGTDGVLSIELSTVIAEVKSVLAQGGVGFAAGIPEIDRAIPLAQLDQSMVAQVRTAYDATVIAGYWLPWLSFGMLIAGVLVARNRIAATMWAGVGLAFTFLLLIVGFAIGRQFFAGMVSPSVMPAATATSIFDQLTGLLTSFAAALMVFGGALAVCAWVAGKSRPARKIREVAEIGFSAARRGAERHGILTGKFGSSIERLRPVLNTLTVLVGIIALFMVRPITMTSVIWTIVLVLLVLLIIELVRRPVADSGGAAATPPNAAADSAKTQKLSTT